MSHGRDDDIVAPGEVAGQRSKVDKRLKALQSEHVLLIRHTNESCYLASNSY